MDEQDPNEVPPSTIRTSDGSILTAPPSKSNRRKRGEGEEEEVKHGQDSSLDDLVNEVSSI